MPQRVSYQFDLGGDFVRKARAISAKTKAIRTQFKKLGPAARATGRLVKGAFGGMKRAALGFMTSMAPMIAGFAGIAGAMKFFSAGIGFQDAMLDLQAITGATGEDLQFLKTAAMEMGKAARVGAAETAKAFELVASAKPELLKSTKALAAMTEQVMLLSNASGLDLAAASETVAESLNQFGAGADQAGRFVNVLAAGAKLGSSLVPQTGAALREVGGIASKAGISFETTNAALQLLATGGIKGAKAGTQLKGVLLGLTASGISKFTPSIVGMEQALLNLRDAHLSEIQMIKLFGRENLGAGQELLLQVDNLSSLTKAMTGTSIATEQANIRMSGMSSRLKGVGVTLVNSLLKVFEQLTPQFEAAITGMEKFFDSISNEDIATFANGLSTIFGFLTSIVSVSLKVASALGQAFDLLGGGAGAALADMMFGGEKTAASSKGLKNAIHSSTSTIDMQVSAGPGSAIDSVKTATKGGASLNVGINNAEAA